ncbi:MAG: hypothetical protein LBT69_03125 [Lactobacillales bacterium]|nr:hypothetical protein [Lactobacillales bacterium]
MKNRNNLILNCFLIVGYIGMLTLFVLLFIQEGGLTAEISKLSKIKKILNISPENLILIVSVIWVLISILIQYGIAKFLTVLCSESKPTRLMDVLIPKSLILVFNVALITIFKVNSHIFFLYTALAGTMLIFVMSYIRQRKVRNSFIFTLPFLIDALASLMKNF